MTIDEITREALKIMNTKIVKFSKITAKHRAIHLIKMQPYFGKPYQLTVGTLTIRTPNVY